MNWLNSIHESIDYIENHLEENVTIDDIAKYICISPFYFQKCFTILCGFTVGEYIRNRKLSLAGAELIHSNKKVIDIALKYSYDSPDSFTKAFTRFHGVTPTAIRKDGAMIKSFAPLKINVSLKGASLLNYKIMEKDAFFVIGISKLISYEDAEIEVPKLWKELYETGKNKIVTGMYGINMDKEMGANEFEFMIADDYRDHQKINDGFQVKRIPKHTWAMFACKGPAKEVLPEINKQIFTEWLPNCKEYEIAEGYNIESYSDPSIFLNGVEDKDYYCEIWIPIKKLEVIL